MRDELNGVWLNFLIIVSCVGGVIAVIPVLAKLAFFIPLIGHIFFIMPLIAFYSWVLTIVYLLLRFFKRGRFLATIVVVAGAVFAVPYLMNMTVLSAIEEAKSRDVSLKDGLTVRGGAIWVDARTAGNRNKVSCDRLCLALLYNGVFETVYVSSKFGREHSVFTIEQRSEECPAVGEFLDDVPRNLIIQHMVMGRCLIENSSIEKKNIDADYIVRFERYTRYLNPRDNKASHHREYLGLRENKVEINAVVLLDGKTEDELFRKSKMKAGLLTYPLALHPFDGNGMNGKMGWWRDYRESNVGAVYQFDQVDDLFVTMFGEDAKAVRPQGDDFDLGALIVEGVKSASDTATRKHDLLGQYLKQLSQKDYVVTEKDHQVLIRALGDDRFVDWKYLQSVVRHMKDGIRDDVVQAMAQKLVRSPDINVAWGISSLSLKHKLGVQEEIGVVVRDKARRSKAEPVIDDLAYGDPAIALEIYQEVLEEYMDLQAIDDRAQRRVEIREFGKAH